MGQIIKVQWPVSAAPIRGRIYNTLLGVLNDRCNSFNIEGSHSTVTDTTYCWLYRLF